MADFTLRPTLKFVKAAAVCLAVVAAAIDVALYREWRARLPGWTLAIPWVLPLWPGGRALRLRTIKATVAGDRLYFQQGLAARATRTLPLARVQNVDVRQSAWQRIFAVGDLSIETAGESSRITIPNVDAPQAAADAIADRAQVRPTAGP